MGDKIGPLLEVDETDILEAGINPVIFVFMAAILTYVVN